jgi:polar amino acid transport system permease protein
MTRAAQLIASSTFKNMTVFTLVGILYLCMSLPLSALSAWLERRFKAK